MHTDLSGKMLLQPFPVFVDVGGIHNQHIASLSTLVNQQIIHNSAIGITEKCILGLTVLQSTHIVGRHLLKKLLRICSLHGELAHMRDIEQSSLLPYRLMFLHNSTELDRQLPASKINTSYSW
ncbi:hypothetical protein D1872_251500 [compost metagenome]